MNDEFVPALSRDRLGGRFGDFSGGIVAKLVPIVVAHHPVVEIVVRNNVNSGGCHRPSSTRGAKIASGLTTAPLRESIFSTAEKIGRI
jgi:hypothetical protein